MNQNWLNPRYFGKSPSNGTRWRCVPLFLSFCLVLGLLYLISRMHKSQAVYYHRVLPGETLRSIAATYYHNPARWSVIFMANREVLSRTKALQVGQRLLIPRQAR